MSVDVQGLRRTIRNIEQQVQQLNAEVARLRQIADEAEGGAAAGAGRNGVPANDLASVGLELPPSVRIKGPDEIVAYLRAHPDMVGVVGEAGAALVKEFRGERSEIELVLYRDPEIEDRTLTFYVRVSVYEDSFMPRLDKVYEHLDDRLAEASQLLLITTDHWPVE